MNIDKRTFKGIRCASAEVLNDFWDYLCEEIKTENQLKKFQVNFLDESFNVLDAWPLQ